ncbi:hypothetical protein [Bradyrhizobium liaoningense]|uniref:hypothetical protein n=1 Tax=Bradyrhizobium liaoningense TaxID=43992 RepID=UPI001BAB56BB|nr:hypothetical protein [Bradyrhizobium liaoningense]MBR0945961.1 hypothetical protein [Bradyrhizobium liaoningense]
MDIDEAAPADSNVGMRKSTSSVHFEAIVALVESGLSVPAACASNPAFPRAPTFITFCHRTAERRARLAAAVAVRESASTTAVRRRAISADDFEAALKAIAENPTVPVGRILVHPLPSQNSVQKRCGADPAFAARFAAVIAERRAKTTKRRQTYQADLLSRSLSSNEFYAAADRAVPRYFDPADREDIVANLVFALIEGQISVDEVSGRVREFTTAFYRQATFPRCASLDAETDDDGESSMLSSLSADIWTAA